MIRFIVVFVVDLFIGWLTTSAALLLFAITSIAFITRFLKDTTVTSFTAWCSSYCSTIVFAFLSHGTTLLFTSCWGRCWTFFGMIRGFVITILGLFRLGPWRATFRTTRLFLAGRFRFCSATFGARTTAATWSFLFAIIAGLLRSTSIVWTAKTDDRNNQYESVDSTRTCSSVSRYDHGYFHGWIHLDYGVDEMIYREKRNDDLQMEKETTNVLLLGSFVAAASRARATVTGNV